MYAFDVGRWSEGAGLPAENMPAGDGTEGFQEEGGGLAEKADRGRTGAGSD